MGTVVGQVGASAYYGMDAPSDYIPKLAHARDRIAWGHYIVT